MVFFQACPPAAVSGEAEGAGAARPRIQQAHDAEFTHESQIAHQGESGGAKSPRRAEGLEKAACAEHPQSPQHCSCLMGTVWPPGASAALRFALYTVNLTEHVWFYEAAENHGQHGGTPVPYQSLEIEKRNRKKHCTGTVQRRERCWRASCLPWPCISSSLALKGTGRLGQPDLVGGGQPMAWVGARGAWRALPTSRGVRP